jgi:tagaturonate reductase
MAMPQLNKDLILSGNIKSQVALNLPSPDDFEYPEKILQFGTGVLLRGLCDISSTKPIVPDNSKDA